MKYKLNNSTKQTRNKHTHEINENQKQININKYKSITTNT